MQDAKNKHEDKQPPLKHTGETPVPLLPRRWRAVREDPENGEPLAIANGLRATAYELV
jgi:hypothetical protein